MGSDLMAWPKLQPFILETPGGLRWLDQLKKMTETGRLGPLSLSDRVYGGYLFPLRGEQDSAHGAILVIDDLTGEVDLQERLRRAENLAAVGRMSAQVAHEVRNPLHSIGLEAEMAAELAARHGDRQLRQSLYSILTSVDRLQKITENYLKLSRLSDGQRTLTEVGEVLESVIATYAPVCEVQGVQVIWTQDPNASLKVWADHDLLEQVLGNLFRNSLQSLEGKRADATFSPQISWYLGNQSPGYLLIRIEDNGPGISEEVKGRLFTPFVTTRAQGTGLGLSFIKQVVEDHGGTIRNLDRPEGKGACFEVRLPSLQVNASVVAEEVLYAENITSG
jgi:signal transduction histidine kinase